MPENFFARHESLLKQAVAAIQTRGYWSPFSEIPSPKAYGETANDEGKNAFEALLHKPFPLDQPGTVGETGREESPFGFELGVTYPKSNLDDLIAAVQRAEEAWRNAGPETWTGVALESLVRLNKKSFEMAYAVMHTTGQAFMMAFQAGGP
ncbi:MAG: phenylacetic acid degradation protein PaaN, partial [Acidobacteriaceae bacterium]|nr:phenylacetic acid degradation protein PaaN [Acidobacteriaceae bacterium]